MSKTYNTIQLTSAQERLWSETRVAMQWVCPAFSHVFYSMMSDKTTGALALFTDEIPIAATDGARLILNPTKFFTYSLQKRVFICLHEIGHCIFDHIGLAHRFQKLGKITYPDGSTLPVDHQLLNIAEDLVINDMLIQSKCGEYDNAWLHDITLGTHKDSSIDVYRRIYRSGRRPDGEQFDLHLEPGAAQGKQPDEAKRDEGEWKVAIAAGAAAAKAQGKLPAAMELFVEALLEPQVSWTDKIQSFFARKVGSGSYDFRRPDRRLVVRDIYAPGRTGYGAGLVVIAVDTSGSITNQLLQRFFSEITGVLDEVRPKRLLVMWIDAHVHRVDEVEEVSDLLTLKPVGGGGTDFRPAFQWVTDERLEPDCLLYLTDGYGTFGDEPTYPVLWGNISDNLPETHYPFGDVVAIPCTY